MKSIHTLTIIALLVFPLSLAAEDEVSVKDWSFTIRIGGFSTSHDEPWNDWAPSGTFGLEMTHYINNSSAVSLTIDGSAFAGDYVGMMPVTVSYKLFPLGNGSVLKRDAKKSPLLPWIGGGAGIYLNGPHRHSVGDITFGTHASTGVIIPFGSSFEINGELRYTVTSDIRLFNYLLGFGFRF